MSNSAESFLRSYKKDCLFDEHRSLSSFVEKEIVVTACLRAWCATVWLLGLLAAAAGGVERGLAGLALLVVVCVFWGIDVLYSYYGVIYKVRRLKVREHIDALPAASEEDLACLRSPANPFDGLVRGDKVDALRDTLASPAVSSAYVVLLGLTFTVFVFG